MKLSIITINYHNASGLRKTIESVVNQTSTDFEYIVVDGAAPLDLPVRGNLISVTKDVEIINQFVNETFQTENGFTCCTWLSPSTNGGVGGGFYSEPDSGIYNAMNKGIRMAKGEYVQFLNSGDWLVDEQVVEKMLGQIERRKVKGESNKTKDEGEKEGRNANDSSVHGPLPGEFEEELDILVGNVISVRPDGKIRLNKNSTDVSLLTFYSATIMHSSAYIKRSLFDKYGLYDESLKIVADWKWYLIVAGLHKANVVFTDISVSYFDSTGISSTNLALDKAERRRVLEELIPAPILVDYDKTHFGIVQMERIKRYPLLYGLIWFAERCLFKLDKWKEMYWGYKRIKKI